MILKVSKIISSFKLYNPKNEEIFVKMFPVNKENTTDSCFHM